MNKFGDGLMSFFQKKTLFYLFYLSLPSEISENIV
jgi:hypothetical protein